jgi:uncharacterized repeat protein (TIGR02543 family)
MNVQAAILYVSPNGTTTAENAANATSWQTACNDLQAVINAIEYTDNGDTVFVAAGTYKPLRRADEYRSNNFSPNDRTNAFVIRKSIHIFGSFTGTENSLEERQLPASGDYTSILSGDFNGNDGTNFSGINENAYHVLLILDNNTARNVRVDGFTIRGGNANGGSALQDNVVIDGSFQFERERGGGIFCEYLVRPILSNLKITGNSCATGGGGIYNITSYPVLNNVIISGNRSTIGGGMFNAFSSPALSNVIISGNTSQNGGGMYNSYSNPVFNNVCITGNTATVNGGGIHNSFSNPVMSNVVVSGNKSSGQGGGIYIGGNNTTLAEGAFRDLIMTNAVIINNTASNEGGGMYIHNASPFLTNVSISNNTAGAGGGIYNSSYDSTSVSAPEIRNSIIWGNTSDNVSNTEYSVPVYSYSLIEGETLADGEALTGGVILNSDPLFDDNYNLQEGSPCINAGSNQFYTAGQTPDLSAVATDLNGNPRIITKVDLGACEWQYCNLTFAGEEINIEPQTIEYGKLVTQPENPERTNYTFGGWFTDNNSFLNEWDFETDAVTQDTTLWAKWNINIHTITFAGEEINIEPQTIEYGKLVTQPENPERTNYTFGGWFTDNNTFLNKWDFETYAVTQDTTLWAKWEQQTGISETESASIKIYPNPVKDELLIESADLTITKVEILDLSGKTVYRFNNVKNKINVSLLPKGVYFVKLETGKGIVTKKIIKK